MNTLVADYPDQMIHVILDNLSTHKPKADLWLARHPNVRFHYTPTHTSWLNQIEIWFSILTGKSLAGAFFNSVDQLKAHIDSFIAAYNADARPFAWTKSHVHQKRLKPRFADQ
jgi:transposase